jgi:glycosyltransferase involved in cell wall biosynthesis
VATGRRTIPRLRGLGRQARDVTVIRPGTDRVAPPRARGASEPPLRLLCVANLTPGKGVDVLLRAVAAAPAGTWTLGIAGSPARAPRTAAALRAQADELGIAAHVAWLGELDEQALTREYARADLFVLATRGETYGMAVAEAIAHGLPVISTTTGEIPEIAGEGGVLAEPDSVPAFTAALLGALSDAALRERLVGGARHAASLLPTWDAAAQLMEDVLLRVAAHG